MSDPTLVLSYFPAPGPWPLDFDPDETATPADFETVITRTASPRTRGRCHVIGTLMVPGVWYAASDLADRVRIATGEAVHELKRLERDGLVQRSKQQCNVSEPRGSFRWRLTRVP